VVGLAATVEQLPVGHDDLAEEAAAQGVDECLLVACIKDSLPVLQQGAECQQNHVNHQDTSNVKLYACFLRQVLYEEDEPIRFFTRAYV